MLLVGHELGARARPARNVAYDFQLLSNDAVLAISDGTCGTGFKKDVGKLRQKIDDQKAKLGSGAKAARPTVLPAGA
jgi:hypothetical protein